MKNKSNDAYGISTKGITEQQEEKVKAAAKAREVEVERLVKEKFELPQQLHSISIKPLWGDRYRVNIYERVPDNSVFGERVQIHSSHFLRVGESGIV